MHQQPYRYFYSGKNRYTFMSIGKREVFKVVEFTVMNDLGLF
ncbi:MAG: hypothetical protein WCF67_15565 [Chitinophagaceae bacterium]